MMKNRFVEVITDIITKSKNCKLNWTKERTHWSSSYELNQKQYKLHLVGTISGAGIHRNVNWNLSVFDEDSHFVCDIDENVVSRESLLELYESVSISNKKSLEFFADFDKSKSKRTCDER